MTKVASHAELKVKIARAEGACAASMDAYECNYTSGQGLYSIFCDSFVKAASLLDSQPDQTPMYLLGRIAYLKGMSAEDKPSSESYSGRWFSGWLAEKSRAKQNQEKG